MENNDNIMHPKRITRVKKLGYDPDYYKPIVFSWEKKEVDQKDSKVMDIKTGGDSVVEEKR